MPHPTQQAAHLPAHGVPAQRRTYARPGLILGLILGLGLALRLGWLWMLQDQPLWLDEPEYLQIATALRQGSYLDTFSWLRVPLFPLWLALALGPTDSLMLARLAQIALGVLLIYQCYRLGLAWWPHWRQRERVALGSALLAAIYLPLITYASYLMAETLLLVLLCALLLTLLALDRQPTLRRAALAGGLLGLAALTKPIALACLPALLAATWSRNAAWRHRAGLALVACACCLAVIAPWTLRNALVHQRLIVLDTTGGFNLWFGNRAIDSDPRTFQTINRAITATYPNLAERDAAFVSRARTLLLADPPQTVGLLAQKLVRFWRLDADVLATHDYGELAIICPAPQSPETSLQNYVILGFDAAAASTNSRSCHRLGLNLLADLVYVPLVWGGLAFLLAGRWPRLTTVGWLWLAAIIGATVLTVVQPRLRLPLLPVLLPWATAGLLSTWRLLRRQGCLDALFQPRKLVPWRARRCWRALLLVPALLASLWLFKLPALLGSQLALTRGHLAWSAGDLPTAHAALRTAATWYPEHIDALVAAGQSAEALGHTSEALAWYRAASSRISHEPHPRIGAARILAQRGDVAGARTELGRTLLGAARQEARAFYAPLVPARRVIDIGATPAAANYGYTLGLYPADQPSAPAAPDPPAPSFRAMGALAALRFGSQPTPAAILSLRLSGGRPAAAPDPWLRLALNDRLLLHTPVARDWRTYHLLVPPTHTGVRIALETNPFIPANFGAQANDTRPYGLALDQATLWPLSPEPYAPLARAPPAALQTPVYPVLHRVSEVAIMEVQRMWPLGETSTRR